MLKLITAPSAPLAFREGGTKNLDGQKYPYWNLEITIDVPLIERHIQIAKPEQSTSLPIAVSSPGEVACFVLAIQVWSAFHCKSEFIPFPVFACGVVWVICWVSDPLFWFDSFEARTPFTVASQAQDFVRGVVFFSPTCIQNCWMKGSSSMLKLYYFPPHVWTVFVWVHIWLSRLSFSQHIQGSKHKWCSSKML